MRIAAPTVVALAVLTLAGCSLLPTAVPPTASTPSSDTTPSDAPSQEPTPTEAPVDVDPNVLFTITATSTSPEGAVAYLTQIVYKPTKSVDGGYIDQLDEECDGWKVGYPKPSFISTDVTAVDASPAGTTWKYDPAEVDLTGYAVFKGDFNTFQAYCATVSIKAGGEATGVSPLVGGKKPDQKGGWAHMAYGFGIAYDPALSYKQALKKNPHLSDCTIVLSDEAIATSTIAAGWATQTHAEPEFDCTFGTNDYIFNPEG
jgi:hypothetical protein